MAASRRRRGVGVNSARCAPLEVSCSSPAQRAVPIQTVLQHSTALSCGVEFESKMTGALQRWTRARRAFGNTDASGVDWNPNLAFWGAAHCFCSESGARGLPNRCERKQPFVFAPSRRAVCPAVLQHL